MLYFDLTCFTHNKIYQHLLLRCLYKRQLSNYFETTLKEVFAIILIYFLYSTCY